MNSGRSRTVPGELALIDLIRHAAAARPQNRSLIKGIGDDCAILSPRSGHEICVTTDFSLENVHFRRDWHPPQSAGHRCLARGLSDLAAMGADPLAVFLSLAIPPRLPTRWLDGFLQGLLALARRHRVPLAGGDTAQSPSALISADIVAVGQIPQKQARLRSTAKPGDLLYVTGALGGAAAELLTLSTNPTNRRASVLKGDGFSRAVKAGKKGGTSAPEDRANHPHLYPEPRLAPGRRLRTLASAMIDISDGLSTDLTHLCEESNLAAILEETALPIHPLASAQAKSPADALHLALHGGEDYELLFTASPAVRIPRSVAGMPIRRIGVLRRPTRNQPRIVLTTRAGAKIPLTPQGWEHFR